MKFLQILKRAVKTLIVAMILAALFSMLPEAQAKKPGYSYKYKVTYYAISEHFTAKKHNQYSHHFIGVEYQGWSVSKFRNSYYKRSYMVAYTYRWQLATHWETSLMLGGVKGYQGVNSCSYICPVLSPGITYTRFRFVQPRLSIMGAALVLSFSGNF